MLSKAEKDLLAKVEAEQRKCEKQGLIADKTGKARKKTHACTLQASLKGKKTLSQDEYLALRVSYYMLKILSDEGLIHTAFKKNNKDEFIDEVLPFLTRHLKADFRAAKQASEKSSSVLLSSFKNEFESLEKELLRLDKDEILKQNLGFLSKALNLNALELQIIEFTLLLKEVSEFSTLLGFYKLSSFRATLKFFAKFFGVSEAAFEAEIKPDSNLLRNDILSFESPYNSYRALNETFSFRSNSFAFRLLSKNESEEVFVKRFALACGASDLSIADYAHIKERDLLLEYLKKASLSEQKGANVLLYGHAGTGKTEFVKVLAAHLNLGLYEVAFEKRGEQAQGDERLSLYKMAQNFLKPQKSLLLYDEAEDIFKKDEDKKQEYKLWLNRALEGNKIPTIWVTNDVYCIDDAIIRRFDFIIKMNVPKKSVREHILQKYCAQKLDAKTLKLASKSPNLAPAIISRANKVCGSLSGDFSANFKQIINNTLEAQGYDKLAKKKKKKKDKDYALPQSYSLDFIHADANLEQIANSISLERGARLCLYGASGTGKSAFAKFIASKLKCPYIIKSASDLMSMWVGETEKNIAKAFKQARKKGAVLIFDEVDSFLRDRSLAVRSWESTQVNEMLVQMEKFKGIFIATTNLAANLDKACLRRFDMKLEFKALSVKQRLALFKKECELLGFNVPKSVQSELERLEGLTPGDFAAVKRRINFAGIDSAKAFFDALCEELRVKELDRDGLKIGF